MKALSLFTGIAGLDIAAHWAGIETVAFCEREPYPQKVLRKHWPDIPIYDDVCELTKERLEADGIGTIDLIHGGYPCQPFSHAGNRKGKDDDRHLWPEVRRLIETIRPRWFVGENVAGHVSLGLDDVLSDLEDLGYTAKPFIIPAAAVGAPHRRDRVFIVGYAESIDSRGLSIRAREENAGPAFASQNVEHTECCGCGREPRWGAESEFEDGHIGMESRNVANAPSERLSIGRQTEWSEIITETGAGLDTEPERCSQTLANAESERRGEAREHFGRSEKWTTGGCSDVADSQCLRQSRQGELIKSCDSKENRKGETNRTVDVRIRAIRAAQSRMGGALDGISARMDGFRWPAGRGQQQCDWEPPRVKTGVKHRVGRLKALGNAVVPAQVYPIFEAIMKIEAMNIH
ncbi:DNA cytosine methyltransferase [Bacillus sp. FJAT-26390]|uniref:DNA cytosine methyltransferase n=1 Tax=Bacillus sp. FJAT-26390 TaxID=1743142 RepID=UPI000807F075|nr:DNA cytosine methyltransferase [Bacillus sp. FJAT-26390]OBZ13304.1 hypothetical protein A7975_10625 [Bacillus sp. FJAT-26390]